MRKNRIRAAVMAAALALSLLAGCAAPQGGASQSGSESASGSQTDAAQADGSQVDLGEDVSAPEDGEMEIGDELVPLTSVPSVPTMLTTEAPGTVVYGNAKASIDASNTADGYVMVRYLGDGTQRLKVLITGPSGVVYNYNLTTSGDFEAFPLSDGNGSYKVAVYQNISGTKYSTLYSTTFSVTLKDEFAPFLRPNQYVNYNENTKVVQLAAQLTQGMTSTLEKVQAVYDYVIHNYTYDRQLAATVQSGYLPDLDAVYEKKMGICFDYAATMTAMLRSQGIPCKLVVGYAGTVYHAWISTYSEETGWVEGNIFFDGHEWKLMDPTFASSGNSSQSIMEYIGNGDNYSAKYLY